MSKHPYDDVRERVEKDLAKHGMKIFQNEGNYRHVAFARTEDPKWLHWFTLTTFPGVLVFSGDMGTYVFSRLDDMFQFFGTGPYINPGYWGEKLRAHSGYKDFSEERLEEAVREAFTNFLEYNRVAEARQESLWEDIEYEILGSYTAEEAHSNLASFNRFGLEFVDSWEWDLNDFTPQYLWACAAIQWGIARFYEATNGTGMSMPTK